MFKNPQLLSLQGSDAGLKRGLRFLPWVGCVSEKGGEEDDDTCQMPQVPVSRLISNGCSCAVTRSSASG